MHQIDQSVKLSLVDGSKMESLKKSSERLRLRPLQESKLDTQASIRRCQIQERIFNELVVIFASGKISDPILKKPVWRLTRVVPSHDMRNYTVYWIIDSEADILTYKVLCMILYSVILTGFNYKHRTFSKSLYGILRNYCAFI